MLVNEDLALDRLQGVIKLIDDWGGDYDRRWGSVPPYNENPELDAVVRRGVDEVRRRTKLAQGIISAMEEPELAARVVEYEEGQFGGHPFQRARVAIIEAIAILAQRQELAEVVGPVGPRLSASQLHKNIWGSAAALGDDGHQRAAVQTAAIALEAILQTHAGTGVSGENLALLFSTKDPASEQPRLRMRGFVQPSKTWTSAHDGAAALVRGAFMGVRNVVSHPGAP